MKGSDAMKRSFIPALALLVAAMLLGGCGGSEGIKPAELVNFKPSASAQVVWRESVGGGDVYIFTPAIAENSVFAAGAKGTLARFDANTGKQMWRIDTKERLRSEE